MQCQEAITSCALLAGKAAGPTGLENFTPGLPGFWVYRLRP
jgi:hypothetical protein